MDPIQGSQAAQQVQQQSTQDTVDAMKKQKDIHKFQLEVDAANKLNGIKAQ